MTRIPDFTSNGAAYFPGAVPQSEVTALRDRLEPALSGRPGRRLTGADWEAIVGPEGPIGPVAEDLLGPEARPVRIVAFDKTSDTNWSVAWHQDRTIAVCERINIDGFGPWSTKDGIPHVAPPVGILEGMVTLRLHLDDCSDDNGPLRVALGSHRLGVVAADRASETAATLPIIACHAKAGDVWAYATLILHASERSRGAGRRRVLQVDYAAVDLPGGLEWYCVKPERG